MKPGQPRILSLATLLGVAVLLAACVDRTDDGVAQKGGTASSRTADAGRNAKDNTRGRVPEASSAARAAASESTAAMGAAAELRERPAGGLADSKVDDNKLTSMVLTGLKADKELNMLRIDVDTRDGVVTLSGSVPSAAVKARAGEVASNVRNVRSVNNQLTLAST
ncbi:MAG: hypothetical protein NVS2B4_19200 [Ramlibacter sp.]